MFDAFADELFADEAAHLLVADAGDERRFEAQPCGADGDIGRAAAHRFGEAADVFEPRADLLAVEVDRGATNGDDVERQRVPLLVRIRHSGLLMARSASPKHET